MERSAPKLIHYRSSGSGKNIFPGAHLSQIPGQGFVFREHDTFIRSMDQKRIDIHATLRNPMGEVMVRKFNQKSATAIHIIADLSASIATTSSVDKLDFIKDLTRSLAFSARVYGDRFSFTGCNEQIDLERTLPQSRDVSGVYSLLEKLDPDCLRGTAIALPQAQTQLGAKPGIVFLLSDFLIPRKLLSETLGSLAAHFVIPVVIGKNQTLPGNVGRGLVSFQDSESGRRRNVFIRPNLVQRYRKQSSGFYSDLEGYFSKQQLRPLNITGEFNANEISQYFHS